MRRTPLARFAFVLCLQLVGLGMLIALLGCESDPPETPLGRNLRAQPQASSGKSRAKATPAESPFAGKPPNKGTIVFSDPKPRSGTFRGKTRHQPVLIRVTTSGQQEKVVDDPDGLSTRAGVVDGDAPSNQPTEKSLSRKIFQENRKKDAFVTSPERFQQLWKALEEIGVFQLPRNQSGIPPEELPSIQLSTAGKTFIFLRPVDLPAERLPPDAGEIGKLQAIWGQAKLQIAAFVP